MNSAANLLLCAADLMSLRGHCNDGPGEYRREVCALEAIAMAAAGTRARLAYFPVILRNKEAREAVTALAAIIGRERCFAHAMLDYEHADSFQHDLATVYSYNDRPGRTRDEMVGAMRKGAEKITENDPAEIATRAIERAQHAAQAVRYAVEALCI